MPKGKAKHTKKNFILSISIPYVILGGRKFWYSAISGVKFPEKGVDSELLKVKISKALEILPEDVELTEIKS